MGEQYNSRRFPQNFESGENNFPLVFNSDEKCKSHPKKQSVEVCSNCDTALCQKCIQLVKNIMGFAGAADWVILCPECANHNKSVKQFLKGIGRVINLILKNLP